MDSNATTFFLKPSNFHSFYYNQKDDTDLIDLGLSLRTLQSNPYTPSEQLICMEQHTHGLVQYPPMHSNLATLAPLQRNVPQNGDDESEGVESKERWAYVKANMDGVIVGRKICIFDHTNYLSLALQLEKMFGSQSPSGLRLFQPGSEFTLIFKDREENWRNVGDGPWKDFVDCVKRLRIVYKN